MVGTFRPQPNTRSIIQPKPSFLQHILQMAPKSARFKDRKTFRRGRGMWRGMVPCVRARMCPVLRAENFCCAQKTFAPGKPAAAPSLTRADSETRHSAMPPHTRGGSSTEYWRPDMAYDTANTYETIELFGLTEKDAQLPIPEDHAPERRLNRSSGFSGTSWLNWCH